MVSQLKRENMQQVKKGWTKVMTKEDQALIEEAESIDKAATPGPWIAEIGISNQNKRPTCFGIKPEGGDDIVCTEAGCLPPDVADALFIAASRTLVPALAGRLRAELESVDCLERGLAALNDECVAAQKQRAPEARIVRAARAWREGLTKGYGPQCFADDTRSRELLAAVDALEEIERIVDEELNGEEAGR